MTDVTQISGFMDWLFVTFLGGNILGNAGLLFLLVIAIFLILLFLMGANRFFIIGFMTILFMGMVTYTFAYVSWVGGLALMVAGIVLAFIFLRIFNR